MSDATQSSRRTINRAVLWTLAAVLLLVWYVASPPLVGNFIADRIPATIPALELFYAPMIYYHDHTELPGSVQYGEYVDWCVEFLQQYD